MTTRPAVRTEKELRKEQKSVEKLIAQLDAQKRAVQEEFLNSTEPAEVTNFLASSNVCTKVPF